MFYWFFNVNKVHHVKSFKKLSDIIDLFFTLFLVLPYVAKYTYAESSPIIFGIEGKVSEGHSPRSSAML